ncbi:adenylate/guanylate cyclase domain-containing protein [Agromyces sp. ZXT2-3]|uniref:adenylate/guanylate cyclase domain-containing protein n=1 Tax=Agromyces sp. ZXT2-3 TaxID=3461152 RepID=UPI004054A1E0
MERTPAQAGRRSRLLASVASVGFAIADDDDDRRSMEKSVLTFTAVFTSVVVTPWTVFCYAVGRPVAAAIPTTYVVLTVLGLLLLRRTRSDVWLRGSQLTMFLLLPPLVHVALGGFVQSSAVILFSVAAPVGALSFTRVARPRVVFVVFTLIVVAMVPLEPILRAAVPPLDPVVVTVFFAVNIVSVSTIMFVAMASYVRSRDRLAAALADERDRTDRLLRNVLPDAIADRLVAGERPIADRYDRVGVLIADIVEFTSLSESVSAADLVHDLNDLLRDFDALAGRLGVTKVKTIGDAYLAISGGPSGAADLAALADLALGLRDIASTHAIGGRSGIRLRVGIDVGPVVAGVIGDSRFLWDVYGATVNTASRMQSTAPPGAVQMTDRVAAELGAVFEITERGVVEVKGLGPVHTSFLERRRTTGSATAPTADGPSGPDTPTARENPGRSR